MKPHNWLFVGASLAELSRLARERQAAQRAGEIPTGRRPTDKRSALTLLVIGLSLMLLSVGSCAGGCAVDGAGPSAVLWCGSLLMLLVGGALAVCGWCAKD